MALCTDIGGCSDGWHYVQTFQVVVMNGIMYRHWGCCDGWHYVQTLEVVLMDGIMYRHLRVF